MTTLKRSVQAARDKHHAKYLEHKAPHWSTLSDAERTALILAELASNPSKLSLASIDLGRMAASKNTPASAIWYAAIMELVEEK